jgi:hypothetical protein
MTVILMPREGEDLQVNWWNWRPTLELFRAHSVLDEVKIEMMGANGTGVEATEAEATFIADFLNSYVERLGPNGRVRLDLTITDEPDTFELFRNDPENNYSATVDWLRSLQRFCLTSKGFKVV